MVINILVEDSGKMSYQLCLEDGHDPIEYANTLAGQNRLGRFVEGLTLKFVSRHIPEELPFYTESKIRILEGFGKAAKEAGDKKTADYVSELIEKLTAGKKIEH